MTLLVSDVPLHERHDLVMLDLDGVVYVGPDAVPGAADALERVREAGGAVAYLTNNAARPAPTVAAHLRELGMPLASDGEVVTSAQAVSRLIASDLPTGSRILVIGGEGLRVPLVEHDLVPVASLDEDPVAVVQGFSPDLTWRDLAEASAAVGRGLPWYASNTDLTVPTPRGPAPGNGSLVGVVRQVTGREPVVAGKPERALFDETLARTGAERPLMVGDRLDTDIEGARRLDIAALAVLTGVEDVTSLAAARPDQRPDFVARDLSGLLETHLPVESGDDWATCGEARAELADGRVTLTAGEPRSTAALRAVLSLAWHAADGDGTAPRVDDRMDA